MKEDKKGLELLADKIEEELQTEEAAINYDDVEIPQEYHEKMLQFVRALDKQTAEKQKKKRRQRLLRIAAVFLVTFVTVNAAALGTSEAYRQRLFYLFRDDISVTLRTEDEYELIGEWDDYWYPSGLPESYELVGADRGENDTFMLFVDSEKSTELRIRQEPLDGSVTFDTENLLQEEFDVGIYSGYLFCDDQQQKYSAIWLTDDRFITLDFKGEVSVDELKRIAKSMVKIEK